MESQITRQEAAWKALKTTLFSGLEGFSDTQLNKLSEIITNIEVEFQIDRIGDLVKEFEPEKTVVHRIPRQP